ncbi:MAG: ribulose-phosphate 3-epimerase [Clostridiales bacterium]|nr:ribulose-phosphate 3-epimerase [Clostridiales bacterium]
MIKLAPSILASNMMHLEDEIKVFEKMKIPYIHIDIMDGLFVPNFSFGTAAIKNMRKMTDMVLDVHLMVYDPIKNIKLFCQCGADIVSFHFEATNKPDKAIDYIKKYGKKACITINPSTMERAVFPYLDRVDQVLVMGVVPGFGGQGLLPHTLDKVRNLRKYIDANGYNVDIEIDGGILPENLEQVIDAGANVIVGGSSIYKDYKLEENIETLYKIIRKYNK